MIRIKTEKCQECGELVQIFNVENHKKNHELERKKKAA
jgi:hypothetical protein